MAGAGAGAGREIVSTWHVTMLSWLENQIFFDLILLHPNIELCGGFYGSDLFYFNKFWTSNNQC